MSGKTLNARMQMKRDADANWALVENSFTPLAGEVIVFLTSKQLKVGDGSTVLASLPYIGSSSGVSDYKDLDDKPIYVTQTVLENDQSGTQGMLMGVAIYKIADTMADLDELIGGMVNGTTPLTATNCMDVSSALATYGVTGTVIAYSPNNFSTNPPQFAVISCDSPIVVQMMYTNIPSAGVWAVADVTSLALKPDVDIDALYASFFLPETDAGNVGQGMQVGNDGKWTVGAQIPITGVTSWREIQRNVKLGRGPTLYPVHTVFNVRHKKFGSIPFEVVAHDVDADPNDGSAHTMTLLALEGLFRDSQSYAFDEREKICNCPSGLAAGSYYIDVGALATSQASGGTGYGNDLWGFTLLEDVPAGGYLAFDIDYYNSWEPLSVTSYTIAGVVVETVETSENDDSGTDLTTVLNSDDFNFGMKARYGSSNWKESAIRQWLNASGSGWWSAKTAYDLPPNYSEDDGFLGGLDSEFVNILLATEQMTSTSNAWEDSEALDSFYMLADKIFLASYTQVGGEAWSSQAAENTLWTAYDDLSTGDELARVKYRHGTLGLEDTACWWWLRSPNPAIPSSARDVDTSGNSYTAYCACHRCGAVAPACVI